MKNSSTRLFLAYICRFLSRASLIYVVIEFILYLVKDDPFNWISFWVMIIFGLLTLLFSILTVLGMIKEREESIDVFEDSRPLRRSGFQARLEDALREQQKK